MWPRLRFSKVRFRERAVLDGEAAVQAVREDVAVAAVGLSPTAVDAEPGGVFQDQVDHARDGVGAVLRRGTVAQHLDALDRRDGNGVHVGAGGAAADRVEHMEQRAVVTPLAVDQHQHLVGAQSAERGGAHRVGAVGDRGALKVERRDQHLKRPAGLDMAGVAQPLARHELDGHRRGEGFAALAAGADNHHLLAHGLEAERNRDRAHAPGDGLRLGPQVGRRDRHGMRAVAQAAEVSDAGVVGRLLVGSDRDGGRRDRRPRRIDNPDREAVLRRRGGGEDACQKQQRRNCESAEQGEYEPHDTLRGLQAFLGEEGPHHVPIARDYRQNFKGRVSCLVIRDARREREGTADGEGQGSRHLPRRIYIHINNVYHQVF